LICLGLFTLFYGLSCLSKQVFEQGVDMNKLQVLGRSGHRELVWDPEKVEEDEQEALEVIQEAERIANQAFARGQAVFRIDSPDEPAVRITQFDRTAPTTVIIPHLVGG
jgi:hypothetical protein